MNTSSNESPRWVCRIIRRWSALTDSPAPSTPHVPASGHRAHCPACRENDQAIAALENQLRHAARGATPAASAGLEQRLVAAVRRASLPARTPARRTFPLWAAGLAGVAVAIALFLGFGRGPRPPSTTVENPSAEIAAVAATVDTLGQHLRNAFTPSLIRPSESDPLGRELGNVAADARSAFRFLTANFVPSERGSVRSGQSDRATEQGG